MDNPGHLLETLCIKQSAPKVNFLSVSAFVSLQNNSVTKYQRIGVRKMANQLENLVESIKSKVRSLKKSSKSKKPYIKMDKSASVKVEIRSRNARKLIDKTLKAADRPGKRTLS